MTTGISSRITALVKILDDDNKWKIFFSELSSAAAFVGAFLSFALVLWNNICYVCWREGRQLWGKLIYAAIHSVQQSSPWIKHPEKAQRFRNAVITFARACKSQLRSKGIQATAIGGLIWVKSTGLPMAYNAFFKAFALAFFLLSSLFWSPKIGWYTPIVIGVIFMVMNMIVTIGDCTEDPFGTDSTDLPMKKFCEVIEAQITAIEKRDIIPFDLSVGPVNDVNDKSVTITFEKSETYFSGKSVSFGGESETLHDESNTLFAVEV